MRLGRLAGTAVALAALALAGPAVAKDRKLGTTEADTPSARAAARLGSVLRAATKPKFVFTDSYLASGGTAMRNLGVGAIRISGAFGGPTAAYLYWMIITDGAPPPAHAKIKFSQMFPKSIKPVVLTGTIVGSGGSPCWAGDTNTVYRAKVPVGRLSDNGNGIYLVEVDDSATGLRNGEDPWDQSPLPLVEGASLFIVANGYGTVVGYDEGIAGTMFNANDGLTVTLTTPDITLFDYVIWHHAGGDGQRDYNYHSAKSFAHEKATLNGGLVAGPGSQGNDGIWNGDTAGAPLPLLWDHSVLNVTVEALATPKPTRMVIKHGQTDGQDCLVEGPNWLELLNLGGQASP